MIDTKAADAEETQVPPVVGWDPTRGVFIFPERDLLPGVALIGPNGQRVPERRPIVICDPARKPPRRRCRCPRPRPQPGPPPGALTVAGWILILVSLGLLAVLAAASCVGSF